MPREVDSSHKPHSFRAAACTPTKRDKASPTTSQGSSDKALFVCSAGIYLFSASLWEKLRLGAESDSASDSQPIYMGPCQGQGEAHCHRFLQGVTLRSPFLFSTHIFPEITEQEGSSGHRPGGFPESLRRKEALSGTGACLFLTEARLEGFHFPWFSSCPLPEAPLNQLDGTHSFG